MEDAERQVLARNVYVLVRLHGQSLDEAARVLRLPVHEAEDLALRVGLVTAREVKARRVSRGMRARHRRRTRAERRAIARKAWAGTSLEERAEIVRRGHRARKGYARGPDGKFRGRFSPAPPGRR